MPNHELPEAVLELGREVHAREALENYALADAPLTQATTAEGVDVPSGKLWMGDKEFWWRLFHQTAPGERPVVPLERAYLSAWVARVPGLFWTPMARQARDLGRAAIESMSDTWKTLRPIGKTSKVRGGIGTLKFPPGADGSRLVTVTLSMNASSGMPLLLTADQWEQIDFIEGSTEVWGEVRWMPMSLEWASRFPITRGLPRGHLVPVGPGLEVKHRSAPVRFHPFSLMRYYDGDRELLDYVYATVDSGNPKWRQKLEAFFENYRRDRGRRGRYLLAADIDDPLWEAEYVSPEALRRADHQAEPQLRLLQARFEERLRGREQIEAVLGALARLTRDELKQVGTNADLPPARWFTNGTVIDESNNLVDAAIGADRLEALIEALVALLPNLHEDLR